MPATAELATEERDKRNQSSGAAAGNIRGFRICYGSSGRKLRLYRRVRSFPPLSVALCRYIYPHLRFVFHLSLRAIRVPTIWTPPFRPNVFPGPSSFRFRATMSNSTAGPALADDVYVI